MGEQYHLPRQAVAATLVQVVQVVARVVVPLRVARLERYHLVAMQVAPGADHATHQQLLAGDERRAGEAVAGRGDGGTCQ